jgi:hypothetical protein
MEDRRKLEDCVGIFLILYFVVGVPLWMWYSSTYLGGFRTEMKKGARMPVEGAAENVTNSTQAERNWVYYHDQPNSTIYSPQEQKYRDERKALLKRQADKTMAYISKFENWYEDSSVNDAAPVGDTLFSEFIRNWVNVGKPNKAYAYQYSSGVSGEEELAKLEEISVACLNSDEACKPQVYGHLHYGEHVEKGYYDARNAVFMFKSSDSVRTFSLDVAKLGFDSNMHVSDVDKILPVFLSENPLTDEAWVVDPKFPEDSSAMGSNNQTFVDSTFTYEKYFVELLNFMHDEMDGVIGVRFTELMVVRDLERRTRLQHGVRHTLILKNPEQREESKKIEEQDL